MIPARLSARGPLTGFGALLLFANTAVAADQSDLPVANHFLSSLPPWFLLTLLAIVVVLLLAWWTREQRLGAQRRSMRSFHALSEAIIAAANPSEIADQLAEVLPTISQATSVRLYLFVRRTKSLEAVPTLDDPEPMAIPLESPQEGLACGVVRCFTDRAILNVADVRRNPLVNSDWKPGSLRSAMFVPLLAQQDAMGVLEVGNLARPGYFSPEEQAAIQHLANQITASIKLQEQHTVREQLLRSEKLAATGQLISGIAGELRAPLENIEAQAGSLAESPVPAPIERELKLIAAEARRASEIVARLVSFARPEDSLARTFDLNVLVGGLIQFREPEWKSHGLRIQNRLAPEPALILGVQGQVEQVFLDLLVYAEQSASASHAKNLSVSSSRMAGRVVVEIGYSVEGAAHALTGNSLEVCRGLVQSHGGEIRFRTQSGAAGFEVDLPLAPEPERAASSIASGAPRSAQHALTLMLVDSDATAQRQLLGLLAARGHRVIPASAEQAADIAHRLRFDAVIWAVRPGAWKWSDFHERLRSAIPAFVLVSDGYDAEFARSLEESGGYLLRRPIQQADLDRVLESLEAQAVARA